MQTSSSLRSSAREPHLLKTPSTPVMPMASTMSLDSLKGTVSGVGRVFPCSNATPERVDTEKVMESDGR